MRRLKLKDKDAMDLRKQAFEPDTHRQQAGYHKDKTASPQKPSPGIGWGATIDSLLGALPD